MKVLVLLLPVLVSGGFALGLEYLKHHRPPARPEQRAARIARKGFWWVTGVMVAAIVVTFLGGVLVNVWGALT